MSNSVSVLTLCASDKPLDKFVIGSVLGALNLQGAPVKTWLKDDYVLDIEIPAPNDPAFALRPIRKLCDQHRIDVFMNPKDNRRKKLLIADMDSTIVQGETLDDLAAFAGIKDQIAAITTRAMNGELDFHEAIEERVALLKGLSVDALQSALDELQLNAGAMQLVRTMKKHGVHCVLVSGGFTFFTEAVADQVGFDAHHGNVLGIEYGALSGKVIPPILDKDSKVEFLNHYIDHYGVALPQTMSIGDGANDLPMLRTCQDAKGLGMGFYAKDSVVANLVNVIRFGTLKTALYAQGYRQSEIVI